jgi:aspartate racemase
MAEIQMNSSDKDPRVAGVLGGMGPDATVDFMAKVIAATSAREDQDHARLLVDHNPKVPNRQAALLADGDDPGPVMAAMAKGLQDAGADFLVIPCNTAYAFADSIRAAISIPLVSIVDVTIDACRAHGTIGVLATDGCLGSGLYQRALDAAELECVLPDAGEVEELMRLIAAIKAGDQGDAVADGMLAVANALVAKGARAIVAGCTEIPLVLTTDMLEVPLVSSTDILAEATASICAGTRQITLMA